MSRDVSIYIHIPFCASKCDYCDFLSFEGATDFEAYIDALCNEIKEASAHMGGCVVPTVFFGGGTPTVLSHALILRVFEALRAEFRLKNDFVAAIEANPETVDADSLAALRSMGFGRISFGVQSFDDGHLQTLGRLHSSQKAADAVKAARAIGFEDISIDLIFGLPGQSLDGFHADLQAAVSLSPTHISCYGLTIEDGTPLAANAKALAALPDEDAERQMYHLARDFLARSGYEQYELSNFARPGYRCQHNLRYWTNREYLGLGLGASSYICSTRYSNTHCLADYISGDFAPRDANKLSEADKMAEYCILGLRLTHGISMTRLSADYVEKLGIFAARGLVEIDENRQTARLTPLGMDLSNQVFCEFI